jgi:putative aminopeptidase FrvX
MKSLIRKLVEAYGPPGRESAIREIVTNEIRGNVEGIEVSPLGSLHAFVNRGGKRKVMLAAHMDEIGLIISHVDERGFARFQTVGTVDLETLRGQLVRFPGDIMGVVAADPKQPTGEPAHVGDFFIDLGVDDKNACPVSIGDFGVLDRPFLDLGRRVVAKSLGGRVGVAVLIELIHQLPQTPHQLQFAFTVQDEVGPQGGITSAYMLDPEVAITVDAAASGDVAPWRSTAFALGRGPALRVWDSRMLSSPGLVRHMAAVAEEARIPYQIEVLESAESDVPPIQLTRAGIVWGCISIPTRYLHTSLEMVDSRDAEGAVRLIRELVMTSMNFMEAGEE